MNIQISGVLNWFFNTIERWYKSILFGVHMVIGRPQGICYNIFKLFGKNLCELYKNGKYNSEEKKVCWQNFQ